jgi:phosphomannomutase
MLFGSSGIRQRFSWSLLNTALAVGSALGTHFPEVVVGNDTRMTSPLLANAVIAGILGSGGTVRFGGLAPTPSIAYAARQAKAGCMITASHNPEEYNGLKLFNPDGSSFTTPQQQEMETMLASPHPADWRHQGDQYPFDALSLHKKAILDAVSDETSRRILNSTIREARPAEGIAHEIDVPVSTVYRRVHELAVAGVLFVERIVTTKEGKRYSLYRSAFRGIKATLDEGRLQVWVTLNDYSVGKEAEVLEPSKISRGLK